MRHPVSNEEQFKPLSYLICFVKYRKLIKKNRKIDMSEMKNAPTTLYSSLFVGTQESNYFNYLFIFNGFELIIYGVGKQYLTADIKTITNS